MTTPIKARHRKVSTRPDGPDATRIRASDWNDDHALVLGPEEAEVEVSALSSDFTVEGGVLGLSAAGKYFHVFTPGANEPPAAAFATLDTRNSRLCLDFDATVAEAAIWSHVLPASYRGGRLVVIIFCAMATATSGTVAWDVTIERCAPGGLDMDADGWGTPQAIAAQAVPAAAGVLMQMQITLAPGAPMSGLLAGEPYRLRLRRAVSGGTATGDAEVYAVAVLEA